MFESLAFNSKYIKSLKGSCVLLDTSYLIDLSRMKNDDLTMFLDVLRNNDCKVATIMDVFQEFVVGAKNEAEYNGFVDLFNNGLKIQIIQPESAGEDTPKFVISYNKLAKNASLTDLKLAIEVFKGYKQQQEVKLLSSNYNDLPSALLKKESLIVYENRGEVRTHAFFGIVNENLLNDNLSKYSKQ